ncbi:hypothetical protein P3W85_02480 [Cupriavidus basilensis]|uniref:Uncharacterized protein n=1 Tax=Cupriavidus basilensis TaxID=68895 RepID=A0ABT6AGV9_9BURK|nr:hypothetical protein [Cupriavidus basilensis]MDF3831827.1 hypothetical protein [Cupriavidus basilensis]
MDAYTLLMEINRDRLLRLLWEREVTVSACRDSIAIGCDVEVGLCHELFMLGGLMGEW